MNHTNYSTNHTNDIFNTGIWGNLILFADDAVLISCGKDQEEVKLNTQHDLNIIDIWLKYNQLTLNAKKNKIHALS